MKKRKIMMVTAFLLIAILMTMCSTKADVPSSIPPTESVSSKMTVTDLVGETYTFDKPLESVIINWSGAGGPFMTMSALLGKDVWKYIAGMDDGLRINRMDMYEQYIKTVPELADIPIFGGMASEDFNLEAAMASGADAAIIPIGLRGAVLENIQPKLEAAGIPVIYIDYHAETIENHVKSTELLGKLFDKEERAKELIDFYTSHVTKVYNKVEEILEAEDRPHVYIETAYKSPEEYGDSYPNAYSWGGICYKAGGYSIANDVLQPGLEQEVLPEFVLASNPDKIVFTGSYWPNSPESIRLGFQATEASTKKLVTAYLTRPGYNELNATKNGEVYVIHHGTSREMYDCASIEAFAKYMFPEYFEDLDPTATLHEYYEMFLPYEFDGIWYMKYN